MKETAISDILHSYERIPAEICQDSAEACNEVADLITELTSKSKRTVRIGISTGNTPEPLYQELVRRYKAGETDFSNVELFSIDEYFPISAKNAQSRNYRLHESFLKHVNIPESRLHIPDGSISDDSLAAYCTDFDKAASGLDLLVMGIGENGEVGFNGAGSYG